jgi:hypothetical protein
MSPVCLHVDTIAVTECRDEIAGYADRLAVGG